MGDALTYQDDLKVFKVSTYNDLTALTKAEIDAGHEFAETMADGFRPGNSQNVVSEEMLRAGAKLAAAPGSEGYQPSMTFRRMDASDTDFNALDRNEKFALVAVPTGSTAAGEPYDAWEVESAGQAPQDSQPNAYQKYSVSMPAENWHIGGTIA